MDYLQAIAYINDRDKFSSNLGLTSIAKLLELIDNPHEKLRCIHVGGTNGKGSTSSFIAEILMDAGYSVGMFTSPYIERFNERIKVNRLDIGNEDLVRLTEEVRDACNKMLEIGMEHPTSFEIITAIGFKYFAEKNVELVVLEVGLGGRYDATNIISENLASVITPISYDHMDILGKTLAEISYQKAGIFKGDSRVVSYMQSGEILNVLRSEARLKNNDFYLLNENDIDLIKMDEFGSKYRYKDLEIEVEMLGKHQIYNSALAVETILRLRDEKLIEVRDENILRGIKNTHWLGRMEKLGNKPRFIIDGAHNVQAAKALSQALEIFNYEKLILGIGILRDKDYENILDILLEKADLVVVTEPKVPRKLGADELYDLVKKSKKQVYLEREIDPAISKCLDLAGDEDLIIFAGSLYLIADVRRLYNDDGLRKNKD